MQISTSCGGFDARAASHRSKRMGSSELASCHSDRRHAERVVDWSGSDSPKSVGVSGRRLELIPSVSGPRAGVEQAALWSQSPLTYVIIMSISKHNSTLKMAVEKSRVEPFPWHLGVYDAHCHPTDTMSSMDKLVNMKARVLTVMATRAEDQHLVLATAEKHGIRSSEPSKWTRQERILPCFGWHPWFAHQMYISDDDDDNNNNNNNNNNNDNTNDQEAPKSLTGEAKISHYHSILQPSHPTPTEADRAIFLSLPDPTPFSTFLARTRAHLQRHPTALIGEIGLDRSFRIPEPWALVPSSWETRDNRLTVGGREGRRLTPFRCSLQHQKRVFRLQLQLAGEMGRAVSVHGVQAHGVLLECLQEGWRGWEKKVVSKRERKDRERKNREMCQTRDGSFQESLSHQHNPNTNSTNTKPPFPPRICLHSYSGSPSTFKQYLHPTIPAHIFVSFSTAINLGDALHQPTPSAFESLVQTVPDHMLLVESDLDRAGPDIDVRLEDMVRRLCEVKGWGVEEGVRRLGENWRAFALGEDEDEE
ncbi:hypothetical protein IAQ61_000821 [Plenodomus lingam]|uniref:uncharacterized protein n=1 Tax=Leptosphaeria maculans TaxID=5022 RepID=UPI0033286B89|nr:hypothetical protein IAQ61_000821 [Plenodomus lingam]